MEGSTKKDERWRIIKTLRRHSEWWHSDQTQSCDRGPFWQAVLPCVRYRTIHRWLLQMMNLGSGAGLAGLRKMESTPHALKPLQITGSPKSRDMIIQYTMCDMVWIFDCCQVKILYTLPDQVVLYCIIVSYCIMLYRIVLYCIIGYKYIDIMLSIAVK